MYLKMWLLLCLLIPQAQAAQAVFAGGSFWVMEALFAGRPGVSSTEAGWMSGDKYQRRQVVRVNYDDEQISYGELLTLYWSAIDPFDAQGQYCDRGDVYSPAIYVQTKLQQKWAQQSRSHLALISGRPVATRILPRGNFTLALPRQQAFARHHGLLYGLYRDGCGYPDGAGLSLSPAAAGPGRVAG
ncbi:peptide-methionine (S)-S-oxide reductase [Zobellella aerophila]|uniref:Peptide methionine sulfoxide reductase MsrA n=1 Tax=Zobellella aerophila TaxID=870480 RepID=A0ABP6VEC2_9GAMM